MERVLEAERAAERALGAATERASSVLAQSRERARSIASRADERIRRIQVACAASAERLIGVLKEEHERSERASDADFDEAKIQAAVRRVADWLLGTGSSSRGSAAP